MLESEWLKPQAGVFFRFEVPKTVNISQNKKKFSP